MVHDHEPYIAYFGILLEEQIMIDIRYKATSRKSSVEYEQTIAIKHEIWLSIKAPMWHLYIDGYPGYHDYQQKNIRIQP